MATVTLTSFPAGAEVKAYPASNWPQGALPPTGTPLGAATETETVGSGGAVDFTALANDTVYFAHQAASVAVATETPGEVGVDEVQTISITGTGPFTLAYDGQTTAAIDTADGAAGIEAALVALSNIGSGDVAVAGVNPYRVTFQGALAETDVPEMTADASGLVYDRYVRMSGPASPTGGSFDTDADYTVTGEWTFDGGLQMPHPDGDFTALTGDGLSLPHDFTVSGNDVVVGDGVTLKGDPETQAVWLRSKAASGDDEYAWQVDSAGRQFYGPGDGPPDLMTRRSDGVFAIRNGDSTEYRDIILRLVQWGDATAQQTTVGAAGGASALPATPTKFLHVKDSDGTVLVVPAYAAS